MSFFICSHCGYGSGSWMGKCPDCDQWNTFEEQVSASSGKKKEKPAQMTTTKLAEITSLVKKRIPTKIHEIDRVLGGGFVPGEVVLLTGEPGIGKSTILLQGLQHMRTLYISGEEAPEQVKERADRLGIEQKHMIFSDSLQVEGIRDGVQHIKKEIDVIVIDSVQTIYSLSVDAPYGSISQLKEASNQLIQLAKETRIPMILIGHVTKEGDVAGPKTLEHMVDAVFAFEGDKVSQFRILRARKNRYGSTDEVGIFEMQEQGLQEVTNPLAFFDETATKKIPGKALVGINEGRRPLFLEIQALAAPTFLAMPRRVAKGVDYNKLLLLIAVTSKHLRLPFDKFDLYVNVVGGMNIKSPAADLGIVAALISAMKNTSYGNDTLFIGEVGLLGEIRKVASQEKIIQEAKRLSFRTIISPQKIQHIKELTPHG